MTDAVIVRQLQERESQLLADLDKVRLALNAFLNNGHIDTKASNDLEEITGEYSPDMTYSNKIRFVLKQQGRPMLVAEIISAIQLLEPGLEAEKLQKNVSYNLSMLAKYSKIKKYPFNRNIKYSL